MRKTLVAILAILILSVPSLLQRKENSRSTTGYLPDARDKAALEAHLRAAAQHDLAAQSHRTASEHNEKRDEAAESRHSQRALEYSDHAYKLAKEAHNKSGRMEIL